MPARPTYPGVYIGENRSGVRAIAGVPTSIAAFIGWAAQGPVDHAERILNFSDFVRAYGGLDGRSLLGYCVQHFFDNGGREVYVVRLAADNAMSGKVTVEGKLKFSARSPGKWSDEYGIEIRQQTADAKRFCVAVVYKPDADAVVVESFENLSVDANDPRSVVSVLGDESSLLGVELVGTPTTPPANTAANAAKLSGGSDGTVLEPNTAAFESKLSDGVSLLDQVDLVNLLCVPGETNATEVAKLQKYCRDRRGFMIVDSPDNATATSQQAADALDGLTGADAINSGYYFPWVQAPDPLQENRVRSFPPCGFVAGIFARTDTERGVWKAPAGSEASVSGAAGVAVPLTDEENGTLNPKGINCIRNLPVVGTVLWGARTLRGANELGSEWRYIRVRRLALFIEESLYRGTQWVVFEPNGEPLWAQIRLNVGAFMRGLFQQGAFVGTTASDAFVVKCDRESITPADVNLGIVNILVGFAPLKPAEFVFIEIRQKAGRQRA